MQDTSHLKSLLIVVSTIPHICHGHHELINEAYFAIYRYFVWVFGVFFVQGVFFHWYPPKKLKYGKPRLGESTLT